VAPGSLPRGPSSGLCGGAGDGPARAYFFAAGFFAATFFAAGFFAAGFLAAAFFATGFFATAFAFFATGFFAAGFFATAFFATAFLAAGFFAVFAFVGISLLRKRVMPVLRVTCKLHACALRKVFVENARSRRARSRGESRTTMTSARLRGPRDVRVLARLSRGGLHANAVELAHDFLRAMNAHDVIAFTWPGGVVPDAEIDRSAFDAFSLAIRVLCHAWDIDPPAREFERPWALLREIADGEVTVSSPAEMAARFPRMRELLFDTAGGVIERDRETARRILRGLSESF